MSRVSPFSSWLLSPLGAFFPSSKKDQKGIKGLYPLDRFSPQAVLSYAINSTSLDHVQHFAGYMFRIVQGSTKIEDSGPITHSKMSMHRNIRPNRPISVSVAPEMFAEHRKLTPQDLRIDTATAFHCPIGTGFSVLELVGGACTICTISHSIFHRHPKLPLKKQPIACFVEKTLGLLADLLALHDARARILAQNSGQLIQQSCVVLRKKLMVHGKIGILHSFYSSK